MKSKVTNKKFKFKLIPADRQKFEDTEEFYRMRIYLSGSYLLFSIICLWWANVETELHKLILNGCRGMEFKQEFNACKMQMNRFERRVRSLVTDEDGKCLIDDFESLEPILNKYIFGKAIFKEEDKQEV